MEKCIGAQLGELRSGEARKLQADVRRVVFFARDSQHRTKDVHRSVFFTRESRGSEKSC